MGVSFETKGPASFGAETVKEFTVPPTLAELSSNLTHTGLHPQSLDSLRNPTTTSDLKLWCFVTQETAGGLLHTYSQQGVPETAH